ncbi:hypothetical protein QAD02_023473 [Eretmocerus hayati]|uniref:Uncharacterized protein n=1 Tax=Eretmocerus hayati TaxID=131215 RepID=A0ACC2PYE3_9HYME|nr:hypothetical protein QAD02_023473 [Eretmocerus hayati]
MGLRMWCLTLWAHANRTSQVYEFSPQAKFVLVLALLAYTIHGQPITRSRRNPQWNSIHHEYHGPPAPLSRDGRVIDTPEVARAKANHFAIRAETIAELARLMARANELDSVVVPLVDALVEAVIHSQQQEQQQQVEPAFTQNLAASTASSEEAIKPIVEEVIEEGATVQPDAGRSTGSTAATTSTEYQGPLAPIAQDGTVLDTPEVRKAKEEHLRAIELELANHLAEAEKQLDEFPELPNWYELYRNLYVQPFLIRHQQSLSSYHQFETPKYQGPGAPLNSDGQVVDTEEVELAKFEHSRAIEHAREIAQRHPPRPEDDTF